MSLLTGVILAQESYMQDVDIDINVGSSSEDIAEAEAEAAVAEDETDIAAEGVDEKEQLLTSFSSSLDILIPLLSYVEEYGVDRTFLRLYNKNGELSQLIGIRLPATESFTSTPNRYSETSMACLEGLKETIYSIIRKIRSFIIGLYSAIKNFIVALFTNIDKMIDFFTKKMKDIADNYSEDKDKIDKNSDKKVKIPNKNTFDAIDNDLTEVMMSIPQSARILSDKGMMTRVSGSGILGRKIELDTDDKRLEEVSVKSLSKNNLMQLMHDGLGILTELKKEENRLKSDINKAEQTAAQALSSAEKNEDPEQAKKAAEYSKTVDKLIRTNIMYVARIIKTYMNLLIKAIMTICSKNKKSD